MDSELAEALSAAEKARQEKAEVDRKQREKAVADQRALALKRMEDERRERVRDQLAARIMNFKDLNLTDEQKTKIHDIRKEYRPKIHEAGNMLRAAVRDEVAAIMAVIKK